MSKSNKRKCLRCGVKFDRSEEYRLCWNCRKFADDNSEREEFLNFAVLSQDDYSIYDYSFD